MRVFFYLREFPVASGVPFTGPMKAIDGMASALGRCNANVTVLCEGDSDREVRRPSYTIRCFQNLRLGVPFYLAPGLRSFIASLNEESLFILNGNFNPCLYAVGQCLSEKAIPYIAASHSAYHPAVFRENPMKKWPYWYLFERPLLNRSAGIQVLDLRQSKQLESLGVRQPIFEVLNGFKHDDVLPESCLGWNETEEARIMYFGRLDSYTKGLDLLLQAFGELPPSMRGVLEFKGPNQAGNREELRRRSGALGVAERVSFSDPEYRLSAPKVMRNSDIVCLPSRYEGFGLTALEGMIAGRVLLVSECAGIAPHVAASGCGVVVQPEAGSIRDGLRELIQRRQEWKDMGLSGRHYAMEHLSWDRIARRAVNSYRDVVERSFSPNTSGQRRAAPMLEIRKAS